MVVSLNFSESRFQYDSRHENELQMYISLALQDQVSNWTVTEKWNSIKNYDERQNM